MKKTIIFDLDGTLALIDRRRDLARMSNGKINFNILHDPSNIHLDEPNPPVVRIAQMFAEDGFNIVIFSGRSDKTATATLSWLTHNRIPFKKLVMRDSKTNHFTPDDILKKDMLDKFADNCRAVKLLTYKITLLAMEFLSHATEIPNRPCSLYYEPGLLLFYDKSVEGC